MKKNIKCVVVTPESYKNGTQRYPVLYLLHGYSGKYSDWISFANNLKPLVDQMNYLVVCPDGGYGSWYFDSPIDSNFRYETHISKEVVNYIDDNFRTFANRKNRAIAGLSMGGHGALYLAIKHKNLFGAAITISGGVDFTPFPQSWDIAKRLGAYEENREIWAQNTVQYLIHQLNDKELNILIDCGMDDFFLGVNRILHQKLIELKISHDYVERPGGHDAAYWNHALLYDMVFVKNFFNQNNNK